MKKLIAGVIFTFVICLSCGGGGQKREIASNVRITDSLRLLGEQSFHEDDSFGRDAVPKSFVSRTNDFLYYKGGVYLLSESPLRAIGDYKNIYPFLPKIWGDLKTPGASGKDDKSYTAYWFLSGKELYLTDVFISTDLRATDIYGHTKEEILRMMERVTGGRFEKSGRIVSSEASVSVLGVMPAAWAEGIFYAKKVIELRNGKFDDEIYAQWKAEPFQRLVFHNGFLLSVTNCFPKS